MPTLHSKQQVTKLLKEVFPPFIKGNLWSITNLVPSLTVRPQYTQAKLSLFIISMRNRRDLPFAPSARIFIICSSGYDIANSCADCLSFNGFSSNPANFIAFENDPKWAFMALREINGFLFIKYLLVGEHPKYSAALTRWLAISSFVYIPSIIEGFFRKVKKFNGLTLN